MASPQTDLTFCAAYVVPALRGVGAAHSGRAVTGSVVRDSGLAAFFARRLERSLAKYPVEVVFTPTNGTQENVVRTLIRELAFGDLVRRSAAAADLAHRLGSAMDMRSPTGLLIVLVGVVAGASRVLVCKFPSDESIRASG